MRVQWRIRSEKTMNNEMRMGLCQDLGLFNGRHYLQLLVSLYEPYLGSLSLNKEDPQKS